ncbi:MAG: FMN-binding protein [Chitinophagales bacterium]
MRFRTPTLVVPLLLAAVAFWFVAGPAYADKGDLLKLLKLALPEAERFTQEGNVEALKTKSGQPVDGVKGVFYAYQGEKRIGVVVWTATPAYTPGEPVHVLTGFDAEGTIRNAIVFRHRETPGWVDPINNGSFQRQFAGVQLGDKLSLVINGGKVRRGDIVSIANSTISSKGVAVGVSQARRLFGAVLADELKGAKTSQ